MQTEYIYLLTNECMPGWVKVGKTNNLKQRIKNLSNRTAVPVPFECYAYMKVPAEEVFSIEHMLHEDIGFSAERNKEFFKSSPEEILKFFYKAHGYNPRCEVCAGKDVDDINAEEKAKRTNTTFSMLGIAAGARLVYKKDTSVTCEVASDNTVIFNGNEMSLTAAAKEIEQVESISGFCVFCLEGSPYPTETLYERRLRMEQEN